jgi:hypothetical protein
VSLFFTIMLLNYNEDGIINIFRSTDVYIDLVINMKLYRREAESSSAPLLESPIYDLNLRSHTLNAYRYLWGNIY